MLRLQVMLLHSKETASPEVSSVLNVEGLSKDSSTHNFSQKPKKSSAPSRATIFLDFARGEVLHTDIAIEI